MGRGGPIRRQFFSSVCVNLLTVSYGSTLGWASVNFVELQKPDTMFPSGPLSLNEATMVMSMTFIGAIIGNILFPHIVKKYGCKRLMLTIGFPQILTWLLIIYAQNPYYLFASSVISGAIGSGHIICISIFVMEISHDNIRGTLNSLRDLTFNLGILMGIVFANYFDYVTQAKFHLVLPIIYEILLVRIPESPQHLVNMQKKTAANEAHLFFKGTELESLNGNESDDLRYSSGLHLSDFTDHRARRATFIAFSLMILNVLHGYAIVVTYVMEIFASTNHGTSPNNASIIIILIIIVGNLTFLNLVDRAGRRTFFIYSSFATAIGLTVFALYLYYLTDNHALDWVPIVCLSYVLFVSSMGMKSVPFIVAIEIFPKKIEQYGYSNCILLVLLGDFILSALYPLLKVYIGLFGWITFFAGMCVCNALFGIFFLPETRGKSHEAIMRMLDR